jgi:citrate lyase subunit beta/citryl-CoA lyase
MRIRSTVVIPASGEGLEAALESAADAVALTLNDGTRAVGALRTAAVAAIPRIRAAGKLALAIVNHPRTLLLRDDLDAIVGPDLAGVFLPHAREPQDVRDLAVGLREFEYNRGIEPGDIAAFPMIDSAAGLLRASDIAGAAPRVRGLVFHSAGYARDIGGRDEEKGPRLAYARGMLVTATRAHDGMPLTTASGLELLDQSHYGFAGALLSDTIAVGIANTAFTPTPATVERSREEVAAYAAARAEGVWVARLGTQVVDAARARKAQQNLE